MNTSSPTTSMRRRPKRSPSAAPVSDEHGEGEDVGVDDPLQAVDRDAEIALHRRQRREHDQAVQGDHEERCAGQGDGPGSRRVSSISVMYDIIVPRFDGHRTSFFDICQTTCSEDVATLVAPERDRARPRRACSTPSPIPCGAASCGGSPREGEARCGGFDLSVSKSTLDAPLPRRCARPASRSVRRGRQFRYNRCAATTSTRASRACSTPASSLIGQRRRRIPSQRQRSSSETSTGDSAASASASAGRGVLDARLAQRRPQRVADEAARRAEAVDVVAAGRPVVVARGT